MIELIAMAALGAATLSAHDPRVLLRGKHRVHKIRFPGSQTWGTWAELEAHNPEVAPTLKQDLIWALASPKGSDHQLRIDIFPDDYKHISSHSASGVVTITDGQVHAVFEHEISHPIEKIPAWVYDYFPDKEMEWTEEILGVDRSEHTDRTLIDLEDIHPAVKAWDRFEYTDLASPSELFPRIQAAAERVEPRRKAYLKGIDKAVADLNKDLANDDQGDKLYGYFVQGIWAIDEFEDMGRSQRVETVKLATKGTLWHEEDDYKRQGVRWLVYAIVDHIEDTLQDERGW
jgi:hypothetical protein